jgi:predicted metal-dependent peptidase
MKRQIAEIIDPKLPWAELLYRFVDQNSYNNYSWLPPNRKYMNQGMYFPSVRSKEIKNIVFGCDASGSVMDRELGYMASEMSYIMDLFRCHMTVLWFDTNVHHTQEFEPGDAIELKPFGGGGTDFRAPFTWLDENGLDPNILIIFTDLECSSYPEEHPRFPVLWATWKRNKPVPPFGEVIEM